MGIFLLMAAYVNLNDPDPEIWCSAYLGSAIIAFLTGLNSKKVGPHLSVLVPIAVGTLSLGYGLFISRYITEPVDRLWDFFELEIGREIGGCGLIAFEMFFCTMTLARRITRLTSIASAAVAVAALYAAVFLQPAMNQKEHAEHCEGQLDFLRG
eukprot:TRINITY_DN7447_c0_g1_i1.p1 TRINITY_DN7447_c0_g1~~TRINITY_DN7447_c0_g1_i1.p1  ORF type:complete len:154 (-),score=24.44 TRINITY_DN7447_c0_g1_i1:56-517(-)